MSDNCRLIRRVWKTKRKVDRKKSKTNMIRDQCIAHCKLRQVEPAYIECGNGAVAMQVSQVNLFELGPINASKSSELI